jgi:hypothetical protein
VHCEVMQLTGEGIYIVKLPGIVVPIAVVISDGFCFGREGGGPLKFRTEITVAIRKDSYISTTSYTP